MHGSLDKFKFGPDTITDSGVICPRASEKLFYNVVNNLSIYFIFDRMFFIFADNKDNHKVLDAFEIQPDPTMDCGVSCS